MQNSIGVTIVPIFVLFAILFVPGLFWFRKYTGLKNDAAFLALLGSVIACVVQVVSRMHSTRRLMNRDSEMQIVAGNFAAGILIVILAAFALRVWGRWIGDKATAEERLPGQPGVRAWFCTSNVVIGLFIVVCAWLGHDISLLFSALAVAGVLAAYPLLRMETPAAAGVPAPDAFTGEREKIVAMLEAGKITADECAELLQALSETARPATRQTPLTSGQRLMLIGAALVALGFFLPWFVFNPGKEANKLVGQMQSSIMNSISTEISGSGFPSAGSTPFPNVSFPQINTGNVSISGGDIQRGLGWAALALALAAALIPYIATTLDAATSRTARFLCLGVGGIIVLYLLTQNIRFIGIGLIIAIGGYALEIAGALRERNATVS